MHNWGEEYMRFWNLRVASLLFATIWFRWPLKTMTNNVHPTDFKVARMTMSPYKYKAMDLNWKQAR